MTIKRSDVDRGRVDFSDVTSGRRLPPVHPGEILRDEFLVPLELSVYRLAQILKVSRPRLNDIVHGRRAVRLIPRSAWDAILGRRRSSGSIFRPAAPAQDRAGGHPARGVTGGGGCGAGERVLNLKEALDL